MGIMGSVLRTAARGQSRSRTRAPGTRAYGRRRTTTGGGAGLASMVTRFIGSRRRV